MKKCSLILDTDVIIHFHEMSYWKSILANYRIYVGSVTVGEAKHYFIKHKKIKIDLRPSIKRGEITEVSALAEEISEVIQKLKKPKLDGIDPGELECIAIIKEDKVPGLRFGVKDHLPIKAIAYLGLDNKAISLEEVLKKCGILRQKKRMDYPYTKKRFKQFITEGKFLAIEKS